MKNNLKYQQIWNKVLSGDEKVEYEFSISNKYLKFLMIVGIAISIAFMFVFGLGFLLLAFYLFYCLYYAKVANAYAFTNKRILIHRGWLNTSLVSVDFNKITDVFVIENFLDRIFYKSGHIAINTAGTDNHEIVLKNIDRPYEIKKILDSLKG